MYGDRLRTYRKAKRMTLKQLAKRLGIQHGAISQLETNKTNPSAKTLESYCKHTDINVEWLLTGEGSMIRSIGTVEENDNSLARFRSVKTEIQALVGDLIDILESDDLIVKTAITESIKAFKISVDRKAKLEESDVESDFKTRESLGESKHLSDKHRVGGE